MKIKLLSIAMCAFGIANGATPIEGWYTSVFGGYSYMPSNIRFVQPDVFWDGVRYDNGYNVGARFGYQSNPLRYEIEYTFLHASVKHFDLNHIQQDNSYGYITGNLAMANVYYDFPEMLPSISPFLGGGLGYGYLQAKLGGSGPNLGDAYLSVNENAFVYQGTAGLTYNFAENYAINVSYRFAATVNSNDFGRLFKANFGSVGAIYRFDYGNYK